MTDGVGEKAAAFTLHPRLESDAVFVTDLDLSRVLLMNDARYPWLILAPMRSGLTELHDLGADDQPLLMTEITRAGRILKELSGAAKINIAALGNQVPQLHIHIVARNPGDAAWPNPIWDHGAGIAYRPDTLEALLARLRTALVGGD